MGLSIAKEVPVQSLSSPGGRANLSLSLLLEKGERMARFSNVDSESG